jgi:hypothetical protein
MGTFCESSTKVKYVPPSKEDVLAEESRVQGDLQSLSAFYPEKDGTKRRICHISGHHFRVTYFDIETGRIPMSVFIKFDDGEVTEYEEPKK